MFDMIIAQCMVAYLFAILQHKLGALCTFGVI